MSKAYFEYKLEKLNKKLMSSKTREEHTETDREINMLVDEYCSSNAQK